MTIFVNIIADEKNNMKNWNKDKLDSIANLFVEEKICRDYYANDRIEFDFLINNEYLKKTINEENIEDLDDTNISFIIYNIKEDIIDLITEKRLSLQHNSLYDISTMINIDDTLFNKNKVLYISLIHAFLMKGYKTAVYEENKNRFRLL